jgi:superfamily II DNA or RNA helicase
MVLFDECHGAATDRIKELLIELNGPFMYGFSASPEGRGDGADMEVKGLFGEVICTVTYQEAEKAGSVAPIEVRVVPVLADEISASTDVAKQRRGYWRNRIRNKAVAKAAQSFEEEEQVLVIVKTSEHALVLRKLLPEFSVVHAGISKEKWSNFVKQGLCTEEEYETIGKVDTDSMKDSFKEGKLRKVIATTTWKEGVDFPLLRGLVRADGMAGSIPAIQIGGRLSRGECAKVLYDFDDDFGDSYKRRSQKRIRVYKKNGWSVNVWPA